MKVTIAAMGKCKTSPEKEIFISYQKRIPWQIELKELEAKKGLKGDQLKSAEASLLISTIPKNSKIITLDEKGKNITSIEFANLISQLQGSGCGHITFIIGGADGLASDVLNKSDFILSFGKLTWPHMLVRPMLIEQIYRAYTIISGHPYHRT